MTAILFIVGSIGLFASGFLCGAIWAVIQRQTND